MWCTKPSDCTRFCLTVGLGKPARGVTNQFILPYVQTPGRTLQMITGYIDLQASKKPYFGYNEGAPGATRRHIGFREEIFPAV